MKSQRGEIRIFTDMRLLLTLILCMTAAAASGQISKLLAKAENGDAKAMLDLSEKYLFGLGVTKSADSSTYWANQALKTGSPEAQYLVGVQNTASAFDKAKFTKGVDLLKESAAQGFGDAAWKLSEIYRTRGTGMVTDRFYDQKLAFQYGEAAAKQGEKEALFYCGEALLTGSGVGRNDSLGMKYIEESATKKGYIPACLKMGDLHISGHVLGEIDPFGALEWYNYVLNHRRSNIDQRAAAQLGIHQVDRLLRQWQNMIFQSGAVLPQNTFDYNIRE